MLADRYCGWIGKIHIIAGVFRSRRDRTDDVGEEARRDFSIDRRVCEACAQNRVVLSDALVDPSGRDYSHLDPRADVREDQNQA